MDRVALAFAWLEEHGGRATDEDLQRAMCLGSVCPYGFLANHVRSGELRRAGGIWELVPDDDFYDEN